ncbi:uncharacterized protein PRCAT00002498001 [Priceomyces carsonii]|uniref:uncharacterized protein n=1 Tax=Priceomyces carsonii TaxID=28549 RepID=UPI002ED848B6|nr:unnamed protein product [Priceomyces carsonii]
MPKMEENIRKRKRKTTVCDNCKKKKRACNKGIPCSFCIKTGQTHLCTYVNNRSLADENHIDFENEYLRDIGESNLGNRSLDSSSKKNIRDDQNSIFDGLLRNELIEKIQYLSTKLVTEEIQSASITRLKPPTKRIQYVVLPEHLRNKDFFHGINPVESTDEVISFYESKNDNVFKYDHNYSTRGLFHWSSLIDKDSAFISLWNFIVRSRRKRKANSASETHFEDKDEVSNSGSLKYADNKQNRDTEKSSGAILSMGLVLDNTFFEGSNFIEKLRLALPPQRVIWQLIDRFFKNLYPFMPILDEKQFRSRVSKMIGPEGYEDIKISVLNISQKVELAWFGSLLIVMKLSFLSLFSSSSVNLSNFEEKDAKESCDVKYLLNNLTNENFVAIAHECLNQFLLFRKVSLPIYQCAFLMKCYYMLSPEEGEGSDNNETRVYTGILVQMAYSISLHRDLCVSKNDAETARLENVKRKNWFYLLLLDTLSAFSEGNFFSMREGSFDTKLPVYVEGAENVEDVEIEKTVISMFEHVAKLVAPLRRLLVRLLDVRSKVLMFEVADELDHLEIFLLQNYGTLKELFENYVDSGPSSVFERVLKIKVYLPTRCFFISIYLHFILKYELSKNSQLLFFYVRKALSIVVDELLPYCLKLLHFRHPFLKNIPNLVLNLEILLALSKANQTFFCLLVRFRAAFYSMSVSPDHESKMSSDLDYKFYHHSFEILTRGLSKMCEITIHAFLKLRERYYFAWRMLKTHGHILSTLMSDEFYQDFSGMKNETSLKLPSLLDEKQTEELIAICNRGIVRGDYGTEFMQQDTDSCSKGTKLKHFKAASGYASETNFEKSMDTENLTNSNDSGVDASWLRMSLTEFNNLNGFSDDTSLMTSNGSNSGNGFQDFSNSFVSEPQKTSDESKYLLELALDHFFNILSSEI